MPQRREHPYIWTTWLHRLLTGENSCEWAAWFKAHYQDWTKPPSDFDQAEWLMRHTALLNEQKAQWASDRRTVFVEGQNAFRLRGKSATLAGQPDLVVLDERDATIIDVKTGREQPWHRVQVMIYLYALPLALPRYRNVRIGGEVVYPTHTVRIPRGALPGQFIDSLGSLIRRLAANTPPQRCPAVQSAGSATLVPPTARTAWTQTTNVKKVQPSTFDPRRCVIACAHASWDNRRHRLIGGLPERLPTYQLSANGQPTRCHKMLTGGPP